MPSQPDSNGRTRELRSLLVAEIAANGPITFARFMDLALYHPEHGYYTAGPPPVGPDGDYFTSSDVSPLFGAALGRQMHDLWLGLGSPARFDVLELGAGRGLLAGDLLSWSRAAQPDFFAALRYSILEVSPRLRQLQATTLRGFPVNWMPQDRLPPLSLHGCCLSNEVADALPFHRVRLTSDGLRETYVDVEGDKFREVLGPLSSPEVEPYVARYCPDIRPGQAVEACPSALGWMQQQVDALARGMVLVIDYGGTSADLCASARIDGTPACYHRHTLNREPLTRIGQQDITAHVNFTALAEAGLRAGGEIAGYTSQATFLTSTGLGDVLQAAWTAENDEQSTFARTRSEVEALIRPDGLGAFRVLAISKGLSGVRLRGFAFQSDPVLVVDPPSG